MYSLGDVVFEGLPFVSALSPAERELRCTYCFNKSASLKRCSKCKHVRYCQASCQKGLNKTEKQEFLGQSRCFDDLMHHFDEVSNDASRMEDFMKIFKTLAMFNPNLEIPRDGHGKDMLYMFGRVCTNSFSICDEVMLNIGVAIYVGPSILNHSCDPNAVAVFKGNLIQIRAIRPIQNGEEIYLSYIGAAVDRADRQEKLSTQYYFHCQCSECSLPYLESKEPVMQSTICPREGCQNAILQNEDETFQACDCCGYDKFCSDEFVKSEFKLKKTCAEKLATEKLIVAEKHRKRKEFAELLPLCESTLKSVVNVLHPIHPYRVRLCDLAQDSSIYLKRWEKAIRYSEMSLPAYKRYLSEYHPHLGVLLFSLGKLHMNQKHQKKAVMYLQQAEKVLRVSHGPQHSIFTQLNYVLDQARLELQIKTCMKLVK